ncbi:phosphonate metabolism transcriptional regulator PhnF [Acidisoma cellulosilytica]|uniref:Phosphonate metabolism transcriptional regulator PhnF n=1 Tax=Acidisoma cellulosilyticum TaxID=2802395 RepID=A0A964E1Q5_9PROT|nr:phosphonate metabolism transcriptional regulator PhnF [Acidisoma cellulosilyticum]MCB8878775.1 phosphonate metabolism transcriptional regulator PhnF [Acidisoma cellulosilyticum]
MRLPRVVMWQRIAEILTAEISAGSFPPASRLPTETALAERFGVNRHTLRQAIGALSDVGLVSVQHGRGTFVRPAPVIEYPLGTRTRFSEILSQQSRLADGELLSSREQPAGTEVATALGLAPEGLVIVLEILRRADGQPVSLKTAHLPAERFRGIDMVFRETNSLTAALRRFGVADYTRRSTRIWTRMPSPEEAVLLHQKSNEPVLIMETIDQDEAGQVIEFGIARAASQRVQILVTT